MISYLGFPIICPDESVFGTICLSDIIENSYDKKIETLMKQYKNIIESHLLLIYQNYLVNESLDSIKKKKYELQTEVKQYESDQIFYADRELMIYRIQNEVDSLRVKIGLTPKYYYNSKEDRGN